MNGNNSVSPAPMPDNKKPQAPTPNPQGPQAPMPVPPPPPVPGGSSVPPPPTEKVDIRTMASDGASLKASGGIGTKPKTFNPSDIASGPVFNQAKETPQATKVEGSHKRILIISLAIIVVLSLAGAAAYFFVIPQLQKAEVVSPVPSLPVVDETEDVPVVAPFQHVSVFSEPAISIFPASLTVLDTNQISAALQAGSNEELAIGTIQEIVFQVGGISVSAQELLGVILPGSSIGASMDQDFTAFLYHDGENAWTGYVFKISDDASRVSTEEAVRLELEEKANLVSLYLNAPGVQGEGGFKDGSITKEDGTIIETRYLSFSEDGASLNYGWDGDNLVISTSFSGMQAVLDMISSIDEDVLQEIDS